MLKYKTINKDAEDESNNKTALLEAIETEYNWIEQWDEKSYRYSFSQSFEEKMKKVHRMSEHRYVSIGHMRVRRVVAALIAALIALSLAGCAFVAREIIIEWNEVQNDNQGTVDVHLSVEDPDHATIDRGYVKPEAPDGYRIISEETDEMEYCVNYDNGKEQINYSQMKNATKAGVSLDNDDPEFREIEIGGYKGYSKYKDYDGYITWSDGVYLYWLGGTCEIKTLEKMANEMMK